MIDALYKTHLDSFWNRLGQVFARAGLTANAVTWLGLVLNFANALAFIAHQNFWLFGICLALVELLDNVDGAIARVTGQSSRAGAYLDAATDRYKETFPLFAVAWVTGYWAVCFLAITGSILVSYHHARAQAEGIKSARPRGLPALFERLERVATLCIGLVLTPFLPQDLLLGHDFLFFALWILAIMSHVTAVQRFLGGWHALRDDDLTP
ncbi:CDP-alcohol phosphatidyltransferase family protein [Myxococcota bacterium]|nr:CDP-alcohol phosphatidyltransferase family protein [Myxococcota bacterium]